MTSHKPAGSGCNRHFCDGHHTRARQPCRVRGVARRKLAYDPTRTFLVTPTSPSQSGIVRPATDPGVGRMRRPEFLGVLGGAAAWPMAAVAQQAGRLLTIGVLGGATASAESQRIAALIQRLRELGWISTVALEYRWAEGRSARLAEIAAEFVRLRVDVILATG